MKTTISIAVAAFAALALLQVDLADAKRLGGGKSLGTQRQSVAPPAASAPSASATTPGAASNPVMPAQPGAATAARPGPAAPAASGASRWLAPLAGLAAGIGLAALLSHFGLSEGFGGILMLLLLVGVGVFVIRALLARRGAPSEPLRYAGAGADAAAATATRRVETPMPASGPATPGLGSDWGTPPVAAAANATAANRFPPGFDPAPFVEQSKLQFRKLQAAYDRGDRKALAEVMTPELLAEILPDLEERKNHVPTAIDALDAEILEVVTEGALHHMSVKFTGRLREDGEPVARQVDEVWNLVKPVDGASGWMLAGVQQYA